MGKFDEKISHVGQAVPAAEWKDRDGFQLQNTHTAFRQAQPALRICKLCYNRVVQESFEKE